MSASSHVHVSVFSAKKYDEDFLSRHNHDFGYHLRFYEMRLSKNTLPLADGAQVVCCFVNDDLSRPQLSALKAQGTSLVAMRCTGTNNVDLQAAEELGLPVVKVPEYSPHAVAEHAVALIQDLNRKIHRAYNRVREGNFSLHGLLGFDLNGKTVGVIGTGRIGQVFCKIMLGFGCTVIAHDPYPHAPTAALGVKYVPLAELLSSSDIIALHCPLIPSTKHLINAAAIQTMKTGTMIINTSRGGVIDTRAVIEGLKSGKVGGLGIDVYEGESELFFEDLSSRIIQDDVFSRLLTFPNVVITGHQAFFTQEALNNIAHTTLTNIRSYLQGGPILNQVKAS